MTLFARATNDNQDFMQLLQRFYDGEEDQLTVERLTQLGRTISRHPAR